MVLSMADLSLISISNGIKDGTIQNPHMLPPNLRQPVLDAVMKRGFINYPKCLAILSSVDFLNGMTSISTSAGSTYDDQFLRRLINSMAVKLPNGETVGAAIRKLDLSVYGISCILNFQQADERVLKNSSFPTVSQLIAQCPSVTSLALRGIKSDGPLKEGQRFNRPQNFPKAWFPCILNQNDAYKHLLENLNELSISNWTQILDRERPIIDFKLLAKLKLDNCSVHVDLWPELLKKILTLEHLQMINVDCDEGHLRALDWVLPFSMPHLKSFKVIGGARWYHRFNCNKTFVDNLIGCQELRRVHLMLDEKSTDEASLIRLADMEIDMKIKFRITVIHDDEDISAVLDSSSKFKVVRILHEKMDSIGLLVHSKWSPQLSTALEDIAITCSNLTTFHIRFPEVDHSLPSRAISIYKEEIKRVNAALVQVFGTWDRALQLKDLHTIGNVDETVMSAIFENCLNLMKLEIFNCPALRDQHLIDWVSRDGGKLSHLALLKCENVTSEGIIPILATSAERLLHVYVCPNQAGGRNWEAVLNNLCPNAQSGYYSV